MKTVCKKLLCLMLVAMMLVSAVPFAFADEGDSTDEAIVVKVHVDKDGVTINADKEITLNPGETVYLDKALAESLIYNWNDRVYVNWTNNSGAVAEKISYGWAKTNVDENYYLVINLTAAPAHAHTYDIGVIIVEPDCDDEGVKQFTCECGETYTEPVDALGCDIVNGVCSRCSNTGLGGTLILTLWADSNHSSYETITMTEGGTVPSLTDYIPARKSGYTFDHWESTSGKVLNAGASWSSSFGTEFYPVYYENAKDDDTSVLNVNVVFYADGIKRSVKSLFSREFDSSSKTTMYDWLKSDGGVATILDALEDNGYTDRFDWDNRTIYSSSDANYTVTKADMDSNGAKNVYIKVNAKAEYLADVFVYVHKDKDADSEGMLEMKGYMLNDSISLTAVKEALDDEGWSWSSIKMYNATEWTEIVNGENTTDRNSITATGTTKIHVYLTGSSYSSNADTTNPKTGDNIMIAVSTMALAAAALVTMVELKKRKMI